MGETKGLRSHRSRFEPRYRLYLRKFILLYVYIGYKFSLLDTFIQTAGVQDFLVMPPYETTKSTGSGFESQHKLCFLIPKNISKHYFLKHQNQLRPMNISSQIGGADSVDSWLVEFVGCLEEVNIHVINFMYLKSE